MSPASIFTLSGSLIEAAGRDEDADDRGFGLCGSAIVCTVRGVSSLPRRTVSRTGEPGLTRPIARRRSAGDRTR